MKNIVMPLPGLRRLLIYYRQFKAALQAGVEYVSSADLAYAADTTPEQVRKDFSFLPSQGRSRLGYPTQVFTDMIEEYLDLVNDKDAVLVGAGNLGKALALYPGFKQFGLRIVVLFDNDPAKIGEKIGDIQILPVEKLTNLVDRMMIRIGIITTPAEVTQQIADEMVKGGIKAIWNFSTFHPKVPKDVMVRNMDLASDLVVLSHHVHRLNHIENDEAEMILQAE